MSRPSERMTMNHPARVHRPARRGALLAWIAAAALALGGCGTEYVGFPVFDATADATTDATGDDASVDAAADTAPDAGDDTTEDTAPDAGDDTTEDTAPDAPSDTTPDSEPDTAIDVTADTEPDTTPDAPVDTTPDSERDTEPDAPGDTTSDTTPDTTPDTEPDTGPTDPCLVDNGHLGCLFYAADLPNFGDAEVFDLALHISNPNEAAAAIAITLPSGAVRDVTVAAGESTTVSLGNNGIDSSDSGGIAFRVQSSLPVAVVQMNPASGDGFSADGSLVMPVGMAGTEYLVHSLPSRDFGEDDALGFLAVIGTASGPRTSVTVTPPVTVRIGSSSTVAAPDTPYSTTLGPGEILYLQAANDGADLTGARISASAPVIAFAGHSCANVPELVAYCDHVEEQLLPTDAWATTYLLPKFQPRGTEPDVYRVLASTDGTSVTTTPNVLDEPIRLDAGEHADIVTDADVILTTSGPVSVMQHMVGTEYPGAGCTRGLADLGCAIPTADSCENGAMGDPSSLLLTPEAGFRSVHELIVPTGFPQDFVTVIAPLGVTPTLDGATLGSPSASLAGWQIWRRTVRDGAHVVVATEPVATYVYGYGCGTSYAFPGGIGPR